MNLLADELLQFPFIGNTQFRAAFPSATGQYLTAIGCLHAFAKSMYRFSATAMRLKCTFHINAFFPKGFSKGVTDFRNTFEIRSGRTDQVSFLLPGVTTPKACERTAKVGK